MAERRQILDHGYLELVESWGSDEAVITAARMSTDGSFKGWGPLHSDNCQFHSLRGQPKNLQACGCSGKPGDEKLLRYLWENKHSTPFEMAGLTVEVQAPIMVFREWHRHRTQSYSEMSARYTPLPDTNYIPSVERLMVNSKTNKQAGVIKGAYELTQENAESFREGLALMYHNQEMLYQTALQNGVPKELARVHLGVGRYSRMRASTDLRNWLAFLTLRMAPSAQFEIRQYANAVGDLIAECFPRTWALFSEGHNER